MGRVPLALGLIGIGWYFAISIVLGIVIGLVLDEVFDLKPLFTILGTFLGLILAGYGGYRMIVEVVFHKHRNGG